MSRELKTQYAILGALTVQPMSGYDIKKWISDVTGPFWSESSGQVYPTLASLLKEGCIKIDTKQGAGNRPKKIYQITKTGLQFLVGWLEKPVEQFVERNELRLKIFYGNNLPKGKCIELIEHQLRKMKDALARLDSISKHIKDWHKNDPNSYYWSLTLKGAIYHTNAEIEWCHEAIKTLKKQKNK